MDNAAVPLPRAGLTSAIAIAVVASLLWQRSHGGVPSHSFLARADMPSISNWWGALSLPALTWLALGNIGTRLAAGRVTGRAALGGALGAFLFGAVLAVAFELGVEEVPRAQVTSIPLLALFVPLYRAEFVLGFVLALSYTFGGVLPLVIATVLATVGATIHLAPRWLLRRFRARR